MTLTTILIDVVAIYFIVGFLFSIKYQMLYWGGFVPDSDAVFAIINTKQKIKESKTVLLFVALSALLVTAIVTTLWPCYLQVMSLMMTLKKLSVAIEKSGLSQEAIDKIISDAMLEVAKEEEGIKKDGEE